jgi:hypothetical protein
MNPTGQVYPIIKPGTFNIHYSKDPKYQNNDGYVAFNPAEINSFALHDWVGAKKVINQETGYRFVIFNDWYSKIHIVVPSMFYDNNTLALLNAFLKPVDASLYNNNVAVKYSALESYVGQYQSWTK